MSMTTIKFIFLQKTQQAIETRVACACNFVQLIRRIDNSKILSVGEAGLNTNMCAKKCYCTLGSSIQMSSELIAEVEAKKSY